MAQNTEHTSKKGGTKVGAVIILIISAIVFLPVGGTAVFQGLFANKNVPNFGSYNNQKITYEPGSKFATYASRIAENYQRMGVQINENNYGYIMQIAFRQTLTSMAYEDAVKKSGFEVPSVAVSRAILPRFTDETGKYSSKLYNQASESTLSTLRSDAADMLLYQRYTDDVFGTEKVSNSGTQLPSYGQFNGKPLFGLKNSTKEAEFIASMDSEKRAFTLAKFNMGDYPVSEAVNFGKDNAEKFIKYNLSALCTDSESEAKTLLKRIKANEITFEDAVSESKQYYTNSEGKVTGKYRYQLAGILKNEEDISQIVTAEGSFSPIIEANHGYIIFRTDGEAVAADFSSSELNADVLSYMKSNEKGTIQNYYMEKAQAFKNTAYVSGFDAACKANSITKTDVPEFALNYGNTDFISSISSVSEISNLSTNKDVLTKAFALKEGDIAEPFVSGNSVIVLKCTKVSNGAAASTEGFDEKIESADSSSAGTTLMASDRVKNNFDKAYSAMLSR